MFEAKPAVQQKYDTVLDNTGKGTAAVTATDDRVVLIERLSFFFRRGGEYGLIIVSVCVRVLLLLLFLIIIIIIIITIMKLNVYVNARPNAGLR